MGNRKTALDVALFTVASTAYLGDIQSWDLNSENVTVEGRSIAGRYGTAKAVKRKFTFSGKLMRTASSVRKSNLDVSVWSVGGTDLLADLKNATVSFTEATKDGSGIADAYEWPVPIGTDLEINAKLLISSASSTTLMTLSIGTLASIDVTVLLTAGGLTLSLPMVLAVTKHSAEIEGMQELDITLKLRGTPTTATGPVIFVSGVTGTAVVAYSVQTGLENYAGNAVVLSGRIEIADGAIISESYEFQGQGAPTIS